MARPDLKFSDKRAASAGPGKTLYNARKQLRLSREEVAERLHLSQSQVIALENDDFERLPGPTYVRGYLRSYAQMLGLSPDDVIASYAKLNGTQRATQLSTLSPEPEATMKDRPVKFATLLVAGVLVVLAVVWWQGRNYVPIPSQATGYTSPIGSQGMDAASPPLPEQDLLGPEISDADAGSMIDRRGATPDLVLRSTALPGEAGIPQRGQSFSLYEPALGDVAVADNLLGPNIAPTAAATADVQLVIYTREASWADIRDARENKLLYQLLPAGRMVTLVGPPPFSVFLGNPDGVVLEFNGEYFDASRYKRGMVARFTLGAPPTNNN